MSLSSRIIEKYGESMTIGQTAAKGFISALHKNSHNACEVLPNGVKELYEYKLLTDLAALSEGMSVSCAGREFVILRVEPIRISGEFSHNECILVIKGGAADA